MNAPPKPAFARVALPILAAASVLALVLLGDGFGQEPSPLRLIGVGGEPSRIAESLVAGHGYANPFGLQNPSGPTGWSLPAFVGWIALVQSFFGIAQPWAGAAFLALDFLCLGLAFGLVAQIAAHRRGRGAARLAVCLFALLLLLWIRRDGGGWSDKYFVMAFNAALLAAHFAYSARQGRRRLASLALLGGLAGLVNVGSHLLALGLALSRLRRPGGGPRLAVPLIAVALLPSLIWSARHFAVLGAVLPPKTNGPFELALNHLHSRDGVLAASVLCTEHPYMNREAFTRLARLGEAAYVAEQGARARALIGADPLDALRRAGNRALNALVATRPSTDAVVLEVEPPTDTIERLRAAGLATRSGIRSQSWTWLRLDAGMEETRRIFAASGASQVPSLVADRARAMAFYERFALAPLPRVAGWLIALPATVAALWLLLRRGKPPSDRVLVFAYALLVAPYVIVSHASGYQALVLPLQALLLSAAIATFPLDSKPGAQSSVRP